MIDFEREKLINRNKKIIEIIMKQIEMECPDSVDMIAIGGSFCNGDIYEKSDLDLVIIANDDKAKTLAKCFILDDVGFDVYIQKWSSFENMAEYLNPYVTKLIDLDIVYTHDDSVLERYRSFQNRLKDNMNNDELIRRNIQNYYSEMMLFCNKLNSISNNIGEAYRCLGNIVLNSEFIVYMFNNSYIKRGTKRIPEEVCSMEKLPVGFVDIYQDIYNCKNINEIKEKANVLINCMNQFLLDNSIELIEKEEAKKEVEKSDISANNLIGSYEEIYSNWKNKMIHAITIDSRYLSFVTMLSCQGFYDEMYDMFNIPKIELIEDYNPNDLVSNSIVFDNCMEKWLMLYKNFGIDINYYSNLEELENLYNEDKSMSK